VIDHGENRLCVSDSLLKMIACMSFNGSNWMVLPIDNPIPVALTILGDQMYYVHQRPYSIRRVSKRFGGSGRTVRDFSKEDRSIFSIKGCSFENQPIPDPSREHPCHRSMAGNSKLQATLSFMIIIILIIVIIVG
jgi:hypothetical protein